MKRIIFFLVILFVTLSCVYAADESTTSAMTITMLSQDPDPAQPGQYVELRWKVENLKNILEDVEFELLPQYPFSLDPGDDGVRRVGTLFGRQRGDDAVILYYRLKVDEDAVEGDRNTVRLRFRTGPTASWVTSSEYEIRVRTSDAILSVVSVTSEPEVIQPGGTGDVVITLKNEGDSALQNIKVKWEPLTITSATSATLSSLIELPFTPVGSTNEKTIDMLESGDEEEVIFTVMVSPDADSQDYKVELTISYEDYLGTDYSVENVMGLIVGNTPDVKVYLDSSDISQRGQGGEVSVRFVNKDVMDIKFVTVELIPDEDCYTVLSPETVYLGNIDSDDYETAEYDIFVKADSLCDMLPLHVTYKDANNNEYMKDVDVSLKLYTKQEAQRLGLAKASNTVGFLIFVFIVVGGFLVWRYWRKKRKKR